ncbi:MAG: ABC transporter permease [Oscillospiraceae bacterium]|jgi:oligopeptide transport system permease protein|nr:ABC transporter permease [Oscillospiraceae bacterium]
MVKYVLQRLGIGLVTLFVLVAITFTMTKLMPGSPLQSKNVTGAVLEKMEAKYGLDKPPVQQFFIYCANLLRGDLGMSYKKVGTNVSDIIANSIGPTMRLGLVTFCMTLVIGVGIGILMARTRSNFIKGIWLSGLTLGVSVPNFIIALLLMIIFGVQLRWFPILGLATPMHFVLPAIAQGLYPISAVARLTQSSFEEVMKQDYVTMARAKGLSARVITFRHILKNALLPVITYMGPMVAFLLTGSVVIENLYTIPGIGKEFVNAITNHDYTLVMGITIFIGGIIIVCNLLADLICSFVDPRIKNSR